MDPDDLLTKRLRPAPYLKSYFSRKRYLVLVLNGLLSSWCELKNEKRATWYIEKIFNEMLTITSAVRTRRYLNISCWIWYFMILWTNSFSYALLSNKKNVSKNPKEHLGPTTSTTFPQVIIQRRKLDSGWTRAEQLYSSIVSFWRSYGSN